MSKIEKGRNVFVWRRVIKTLFTLLFLICVSSASLDAIAGFAAYGAQPLVETQWLADNLKKPNVRVVYVGFISEDDKKQYESKHVPNSVYLSMNNLMSAMGDGSAAPDKATFETLMGELGISKETHVVLYGEPAGNPFIPSVYWLMKYFGHSKVSILNGVFDKWNKEGRETTGEAIKITPTQYKAASSDESIRTSGDYVLKNLKNPKVVLVDARSSDEFVGKEDRNKRKGHIPGAINLNFYPTNRNGDGTYKSIEDLKAAYEATGVTKDKEVIAYCETGPRAADTYLVLKDLLGYSNIKLYVGSWSEWGNRLDPEKYPLEK
jgi:thiosulfate/3-mercaptopyruvate sulfurtransferase